jgi:hypothetical protein
MTAVSKNVSALPTQAVAAMISDYRPSPDGLIG